MPLLRPLMPKDVPSILSLTDEVYAKYGYKLEAKNEERHLPDQSSFSFKIYDSRFTNIVDTSELA